MFDVIQKKERLMSQKNLNVAILGFGLSGSTFHAPLIRTTPGLKLTHILSRQADRIKALYPDVRVCQSIDEILATEEIDLVINTLPNSEHYSISRDCLAAGKHVVVEKPFVINSSDGIELIKLAQEKNLVLSVYHNRRWDNGFLTLKKCLPELGKIYLYQASYDRFRPVVNLAKWREQDGVGNGILYDLGSHLIDQALVLFGSPHAVFADLDIQRENAHTIDYFEIILYYDKLRVILGSSSVMANPRPVLAIHGDKASFVKHGLDPQEEQLKAGITPLDEIYGVDKNNLPDFTSGIENISRKLNTEKGSYSNYYHQLYRCIVNNDPNPVIPEEALNVIKVIELCQTSSKEQRVVKFGLVKT